MPERTLALERLELKPDRLQVLRYLGYPSGAAPAARISARIDEALERCRECADAGGVAAVYSVTDRSARSLALAGGARFSGHLAEAMAGVRRAAAFVATAGSHIGDLAAEAARRRDMPGALVYDAIGSHLAEAAADRLMAALRAALAPGEALSLRYSPGYCGVPLSQQRTIFRLVDAARVGVELLPSLMMKPVKSVSGLVGIGPDTGVPEPGSPCNRCAMLDCKMRRESN